MFQRQGGYEAYLLQLRIPAYPEQVNLHPMHLEKGEPLHRKSASNASIRPDGPPVPKEERGLAKGKGDSKT